MRRRASRSSPTSRPHGRGRLGRAWASPYGAGVAMSVVLRPMVPDSAWGWIPLLTGVAVVEALGAAGGGRTPQVAQRRRGRRRRRATAAPARASSAACSPSARAPAVVVGIGRERRPHGRGGTGAAGDLDPARGRRRPARAARGGRARGAAQAVPPLAARRRRPGSARACSRRTLGLPHRSATRVRVLLPGGDELLGTALDVDSSGRLVVRERATAPSDVAALRGDGGTSRRSCLTRCGAWVTRPSSWPTTRPSSTSSSRTGGPSWCRCSCSC